MAPLTRQSSATSKKSSTTRIISKASSSLTLTSSFTPVNHPAAPAKRRRTPEERKALLESDPWVLSVRPFQITCRGCGKAKVLENRGKGYYPDFWFKHKRRCGGIKESLAAPGQVYVPEDEEEELEKEEEDEHIEVDDDQQLSAATTPSMSKSSYSAPIPIYRVRNPLGPSASMNSIQIDVPTDVSTESADTATSASRTSRPTRPLPSRFRDKAGSTPSTHIPPPRSFRVSHTNAQAGPSSGSSESGFLPTPSNPSVTSTSGASSSSSPRSSTPWTPRNPEVHQIADENDDEYAAMLLLGYKHSKVVPSYEDFRAQRRDSTYASTLGWAGSCASASVSASDASFVSGCVNFAPHPYVTPGATPIASPRSGFTPTITSRNANGLAITV